MLSEVEVDVWAAPKHPPPPSEAVEGADPVVQVFGEPVARFETSW